MKYEQRVSSTSGYLHFAKHYQIKHEKVHFKIHEAGSMCGISAWISKVPRISILVGATIHFSMQLLLLSQHVGLNNFQEQSRRDYKL
jgi:hypothetical protein